MRTTKKLKTRFKVRIFDKKYGGEAGFLVYEEGDEISLEDFKKSLERKSEAK